jgi:hypothetical protein
MLAQARPELAWIDFVERIRPRHPDLAADLERFTSITSVLTWMQQRGLTRSAVDIIGQDEFHYDFLVEAGPVGWLSFGVT